MVKKRNQDPSRPEPTTPEAPNAVLGGRLPRDENYLPEDEDYLPDDEPLPGDSWLAAQGERDETGRRLPLPSEDTGDLLEDPPSGMTDNYLVASEEGLPYEPPETPVPDAHFDEREDQDEGVILAETEGLEREDLLPAHDEARAQSEDLLRDVLDAVRSAGEFDEEQLDITVVDDIVTVRGEVHSLEALDSLLQSIEAVPGVSEVVDEVYVVGD